MAFTLASGSVGFGGLAEALAQATFGSLLLELELLSEEELEVELEVELVGF